MVYEVHPAKYVMSIPLADWLIYLESLHPKTIALGLERVAQVKQRLNLNPDFPVLVIGGTNGKGSVCALLESILFAAGYRVGCYTSPHLLKYNERIRIAKQQITDDALCASFEAVERVRADVPLTYFEFGTLAAMQHFLKHKVEVAILEVGLGGRLDAVNAFDSDCAVVTSVDIDHTEYLGKTREQIAYEKAGIFRKGCIAICTDEAMPQVISSQARQIGAKLWRIGHEIKCTPNQGQWDYSSSLGTRKSLPYPALRGSFQLHNASAALAALDALKQQLPVSMTAVRCGLSEVQLTGRFQLVPGRPILILDVAHNLHAARALAQNLADMPSYRHTYAVFAMLQDKDIPGVAAVLNVHINTWLVAGISASRGATPEYIENELQQSRVSGEIKTFIHVAEALRFAYNVANENDRILVFGSFYTVAEAMGEAGVPAA